MKHFLLTAAAAAMVLALGSCAKTEVTDVPDSRYIGFDAFIWNPTKAVEEVNTANIKSFYVFGQKDNTPIFDNEEVYESDTPDQWIYDEREIWESGKTYTFAAYSNGGERGGKVEGFAWDGTNLTVNDYNTSTHAKDLLVAIASNASELSTSNVPVQFNFTHALSMIKFTINSELGDGDDNKINISSFTVSGIKAQGDLSFDNTGGIVWSNWATPTDLLAEDFATETSTPGESEPFVVIPGESGVSFTVTFTATFGDGTGTKNLQASISGQQFTAGYRYNYVATITGADMDVITFADPEVTPWTDRDVNLGDLDAQQ